MNVLIVKLLYFLARICVDEHYMNINTTKHKAAYNIDTPQTSLRNSSTSSTRGIRCMGKMSCYQGNVDNVDTSNHYENGIYMIRWKVMDALMVGGISVINIVT